MAPDPKLIGAIEFIRRTGATAVQVRFSDDEQPVVWFVVAEYQAGVYEVAASTNPVRAALRLCERLADGSQCAYCGKMTGFDPDSFGPMLMNDLFCWWQWDPELQVFRRGCEGDDK